MRVCDSEWLWYLVIQLFVHEFIFIIFSTCLSFVSFVLHNYKELLSICNTKKISNPRYPTSILHKCITLYHSKWKVKDLYSNKSLISLCVVDYMDSFKEAAVFIFMFLTVVVVKGRSNVLVTCSVGCFAVLLYTKNLLCKKILIQYVILVINNLFFAPSPLVT